MAYYDALIAKWGTLTGTTAQKLTAINSATIPATSQQMLVPRWQIWNAINEAEWTAANAANKTLINEMFTQNDILDVSPGTRARARLLSVFAAGSVTRANFSAIANSFDVRTQLWWSASVADGGGGLSSPVSESDLIAAGGLS